MAQIGAAGQALSLARTTAVQLATSFVRRMTPAGVGGIAVGLRYLQRCGLPRTRASSILALTDAASFVLHALALLVTVPLAARSLRPLDRLPSLPLLLTGAGALVVLGLVLWPSIGRWHIPALRDAQRALTLPLDRPRWAAALLAGTLGVTSANLLALAAALQAFHVDLRLQNRGRLAPPVVAHRMRAVGAVRRQGVTPPVRRQPQPESVPGRDVRPRRRGDAEACE